MSAPRGMKHLNQAGITIIELMIYLIIASAVLTAVYQLMIQQNRSYSDQREVVDARETVRGAATLLTWELRQLSAAGGDLYAINANSIVLRSMRGAGILCGKHPVLPKRYGLWGVGGGEFSDTNVDSALVFAAGGSAASDDTWLVRPVTKVWDPIGGGVPFCVWKGGNTVKAQTVVEVSTDTSIVTIGGPVRVFRRVEYGLFTQNGRTWLGRRVGAAVTWETLTGPLRPQASGGLVFTYYDSTGAVTANRLQVDMVEIVIRGESFGKSRYKGVSNPTERIDSVRTRVYLRG